MKKYVLLFFSLYICIVGNAQTISVSTFKLLDTDLTANTAGTMETDQNGETAALIKVVTTQTGFTFDGGALGVVKTKQTPGEVWVYVPRGSKKVSIKHPQLGVLRDYFFPVAIEAGRTYEMVLVVGEIQTTIKQARTSQYVVFQMTPPNAVAELDGELLETTDGTATKMKKFGTYSYRIQAPNYLPEAGSITINDPTNKHIVNINLKPNFSVVTLSVDNGAEIWVNGEKKGVGSWTGNLGAGTYEFETHKDNHKNVSVTRDIVVTSEPQIINLQSPTPILGEIDINSMPAMADIFIDEKKIGQTPISLSDILIGKHQIRISKQGYKDYSTSFIVKEGEATMFSASLEKQATGNDVKSTSYSISSTDGIRTITVGSVSFNMILVDGGTFMMGATNEQGDDAYKDENPAHQVTLSPYYIGETEVTQSLWEAIMGYNPSYFKGDNRPVEKVSWSDCQEFIKRLNQKTGLSFRLPTEKEWEFAARGGNNSKHYKYSGSDMLGDVAWYDENSRNETHNVKTKSANELGLYDMSGNVWEWVQDWYGEYQTSEQNDPTIGSNHVYRGGSWINRKRICRVSYRDYRIPGMQLSLIGFRLALQ